MAVGGWLFALGTEIHTATANSEKPIAHCTERMISQPNHIIPISTMTWLTQAPQRQFHRW